MRKVFLGALCMAMLAGCSSGGVSQAEYESVVAERDSYKAQLDAILGESGDSDSDEAEESEENSQSPNLSSSDLLNQVSVNEYSYTDSVGTNWYFLEVTNNSPVPISVETNVIAKDAEGNTIGAASGSATIIENGYSDCISHMFDDIVPESYEYTMSVSEEDWYRPVQSDLTYEASDTGDKVIITCTNNGSEPAEFVEGFMLFFSGDTVVGQSSNYFTDDDSELKPGNTLAKEFNCYSDTPYDSYKFYINGRR